MERYGVPCSTLTYIAFHLNSVIDADLHREFGVNRVKELIASGTVFDEVIRPCWIDYEYPAWRISDADEQEILSEWQFMAEANDDSVMMGVEHNGICLLIGYLLDGIQRRASN